MKRLLVILGHTNSSDGKISETGLKRCEAAVEYARRNEVSHILCTGAFDDSFNVSAKPHGEWMLDQVKRLMKQGVGVSKFAVFAGCTPTAFTEEDLFAARRVCQDLECDLITLVTSQFHAERVQEIAKLVFRDIEVEYCFAPDGADIDPTVRASENPKKMRFRENWTDGPLYRKGVEFPAALYENAMDQYKHCDTISIAVVTGALVVACYPMMQEPAGKSLNRLIAMHALCGVLSLLLAVLYYRYASFARLARRVMRHLELGWGSPGFSYNYQRFFRRQSRMPHFGTGVIVLGILFALVLLDFGMAWNYAKQLP